MDAVSCLSDASSHTSSFTAVTARSAACDATTSALLRLHSFLLRAEQKGSCCGPADNAVATPIFPESTPTRQ